MSLIIRLVPKKSISLGISGAMKKIVLFCALFSLAAFCFAAKTDFSSLSVKPAGEFVFAHTESEFLLSIPGVEPDKVQAELLELPKDVRFISSKKEFDGRDGTLIHFWLSFSSVGSFSLPPISLRHGFRTHLVSFQPFSVTENPALVSPRLFLRVEGAEPFHAGESIFFIVYAQYVGQFLDFSYKLPKDSLLFERERFFSGKDEKKRAFSTEPVALARFEWKPLRSGNHDFPELFVDAISYSGNRKMVQLPKRTVSVFPAKSDAGAKKNVLDDFYDSDLEDVNKDKAWNGGEMGLVRDECGLLHELRTAERYNFPLSPSFSEKKERRRNLEKMIGITLSEDERNFWVMNALFVVTGVFFVLFVLFLSGRHTKSIVLFFSIFVLSLSVSFMYEADFAKRFAIFSGGSVSVIPEELSDGSGRFVPAGLRVKIIEKSSDWVYIETVDCSGWVKAERVKELL